MSRITEQRYTCGRNRQLVTYEAGRQGGQSLTMDSATLFVRVAPAAKLRRVGGPQLGAKRQLEFRYAEAVGPTSSLQNPVKHGSLDLRASRHGRLGLPSERLLQGFRDLDGVRDGVRSIFVELPFWPLAGNEPLPRGGVTFGSTRHRPSVARFADGLIVRRAR